MDQTLLTMGKFENTLYEQNEFIRNGFNITVDTEIGIIENQMLIFDLLCNARWIFVMNAVMMFVITIFLAYAVYLLEKLEKQEDDNEVKVDTYVELKDAICV